MLTPTSRVKRCWRYEAASPTFFANSRVRNNGWLCNKWTTCFTRGSRVVIPDSGNSAFLLQRAAFTTKNPSLLKKTRKLDANTQNSEKNLESMRVHRRPTNRRRDRKSTRLNSSHVSISYAVFCLKKKK